MTTGTAPATLLELHAVPLGRPAAPAGRLPVDGVMGAQEILRMHLAVDDALDDEDGLRTRRREALLHRLQLDRQRRRRRTA